MKEKEMEDRLEEAKELRKHINGKGLPDNHPIVMEFKNLINDFTLDMLENLYSE